LEHPGGTKEEVKYMGNREGNSKGNLTRGIQYQLEISMEQVQEGQPKPVMTSKTLMETPRTRVLAPVIVDLITIYDYYNDGMDTSGVPIINEPNEGIQESNHLRNTSSRDHMGYRYN
jgi:hypothetical protein